MNILQNVTIYLNTVVKLNPVIYFIILPFYKSMLWALYTSTVSSLLFE